MIADIIQAIFQLGCLMVVLPVIIGPLWILAFRLFPRRGTGLDAIGGVLGKGVSTVYQKKKEAENGSIKPYRQFLALDTIIAVVASFFFFPSFLVFLVGAAFLVFLYLPEMFGSSIDDL